MKFWIQRFGVVRKTDGHSPLLLQHLTTPLLLTPHHPTIPSFPTPHLSDSHSSQCDRATTDETSCAHAHSPSSPGDESENNNLKK